MIKRIVLTSLVVLAFAVSSFAACSGSSPTWTTASAAQNDVQDCINAATAGDTINVIAGTVNWTSLTVNKALTFIGAGIGVTNVALTGAEDSIVITKQVGTIRFKSFSFSTNYLGAGNHPILVNGSWTGTNPVIFQLNDINLGKYTLMHTSLPGGIIFSENTITADYNTGPLTVKDATNSNGSWTSNPTMGTDDTSGLLNHYFEHNTVYGSTNGVFDCDDGCRIVVRHNDFTYGMFNSHGYDTSSWGMRHFEIYDNTYSRGDPDDPSGCDQIPQQCLGNVVQVIWIRGGTGVVYGNTFEDIFSSTWGHKPIIRINSQAYSEPTLIGKSCGTLSYPEPRQPGQSYVGGVQVTDPIYFWGNLGGPWDVAEIDDYRTTDTCGNAWSTWFQWGRDAINQSISGGTAKVGYTAFTYPHPLLADSGVCVTPTHLTYTAQPSSANAGATLGTVSVGIYDASNVLCDSTATITLSKNGSATYGTLSSSSNLAKAAVAGVATWSDLSISTAGAGTIDAASSDLTGATSNSITISAIPFPGGRNNRFRVRTR